MNIIAINLFCHYQNRYVWNRAEISELLNMWIVQFIHNQKQYVLDCCNAKENECTQEKFKEHIERLQIVLNHSEVWVSLRNELPSYANPKENKPNQSSFRLYFSHLSLNFVKFICNEWWAPSDYAFFSVLCCNFSWFFPIHHNNISWSLFNYSNYHGSRLERQNYEKYY